MTVSTPVRWSAPAPAIGTLGAMARGWRGACPDCGRGRIFSGWLRVAETCACCAAPLGRVRADDAPPYFVVFAVGHLVIAAAFMVDRIGTLSVGAEIALFLPLTAILALGLLRPVKGATLGLMLHLRMVTGPDGEPPHG